MVLLVKTDGYRIYFNFYTIYACSAIHWALIFGMKVQEQSAATEMQAVVWSGVAWSAWLVHLMREDSKLSMNLVKEPCRARHWVQLNWIKFIF